MSKDSTRAITANALLHLMEHILVTVGWSWTGTDSMKEPQQVEDEQ